LNEFIEAILLELQEIISLIFYKNNSKEKQQEEKDE